MLIEILIITIFDFIFRSEKLLKTMSNRTKPHLNPIKIEMDVSVLLLFAVCLYVQENKGMVGKRNVQEIL